MKSVKLLISVLIITGISSCRKKEIFPDLAKQVEGNYTITEASLTYYRSNKATGTYSPKDSAQIGQIIIKKIDALSVNLHTTLKKKSGEILFDDTYYCELSRDIGNKGWIIITSLPNRGGAYVVNDIKNGNNYLSVGGYSDNQDGKAAISGAFIAKR